MEETHHISEEEIRDLIFSNEHADQAGPSTGDMMNYGETIHRKRKRCANPEYSLKQCKVVLYRKDLSTLVHGRFKLDTHCSVCHNPEPDSRECDVCPRVYHRRCMKKVLKNVSCFCRMKTVDGSTTDLSLETDYLKSLLQHVLLNTIEGSQKNTAVSKSYDKLFRTWSPKNMDLAKVMDLDILIDNLNGDFPYTTTASFFSDVKWIYHNCCITYGEDYWLTAEALKLEKKFKEELKDLEACHECFSMKHDYYLEEFFTYVCKKPHPIIWAKVKGFPFWPAKCLKIRNGAADVRFFGTHDRSVVPLQKCFKISRENPGNKHIKLPAYKCALQELEMYVKKFENVVGPFHYYEYRTPLKEKEDKDQVPELESENRPESDNISDATEQHQSEFVVTEDTCSDGVIQQLSASSEPMTENNISAEFIEDSSPSPIPSQATSSSDTENNITDDALNMNEEVPMTEKVKVLSQEISDATEQHQSEFGVTENSIFNDVAQQLSASSELVIVKNEVNIPEVKVLSQEISESWSKPSVRTVAYKIIMNMKPNLKDKYETFENCSVYDFMKIWLDVNISGFDLQPFLEICKMFAEEMDQFQQYKEDATNKIRELTEQLQYFKNPHSQRNALREAIITVVGNNIMQNRGRLPELLTDDTGEKNIDLSHLNKENQGSLQLGETDKKFDEAHNTEKFAEEF